MEWTIDGLSLPGVFRVILDGKFERVGCRRMIDEVCSELFFQSHYQAVLFDDRDLDVAGMADADLIAVRNMFWMNNTVLARRKIAILMRSVAAMEVAATFTTITEPASEAIFHVFREEGAAVQWLFHDTARRNSRHDALFLGK